MRKKVVAGNWKMHMTPGEGAAFAKEIAPKFNPGVEAVLCAPYTSLAPVAAAIAHSAVGLGAQNVHFEAKGAFTGEISAAMLLELGVKYAIVGHSERRAYFGETDEIVNKKLLAAAGASLVPIVCVGEGLAQREQGITEDLLRLQTRIAYGGVDKKTALGTIIAYEPVWAIGTGKTATPQQAQEACACIRELLATIYDKDAAAQMRILYGGSVTAANAAELFAMPDIDGGLVGGASLKADFAEIVNAAL